MPLNVVGFAGSHNRPSKTRLLVELATARIAQDLEAETRVFDLTDLFPVLGTARHFDDLPQNVRLIVEAITSADALVVGSPVHNSSICGMFKHLFDLIDPSALAGKPVLLTATGGGQRHALIIEHQLRPLFAFFEAAVLPTGVYASSADFKGATPVADAVLARLDRSVRQMREQLGIRKAA